MPYVFLFIAIIFEVIATLNLKASNQFTKIIPTLIIAIGYISSFYFLTLSLKTIPIGISYAIWSGLGTVLVAIGAHFIYKQNLSPFEILGIAFVVIGVILMNLFSKGNTQP